jgi:hypothetical protein
LADGTTAVVADPARDVIHFVNLDTAALTQTVTLEAGARPGRIVESPELVHVALSGAGQVLTVDAQGNEVWQSDVCAEPKGLDYLPTADRLLVACRDGRLLSVATSDGESEVFASLPTDLRDVLVVPSSPEVENTGPKIYVTRFRSAEVLRVNTAGLIDLAVTLPSVQLQRFGVTESSPEGDVEIRDETTETPFASAVAWRARAVGGEVVVLHQRAQQSEVRVSNDGGYGGGGCERVVEPSVSKVGPDAAVLTNAGLSMVNLGVDIAASPDGKWWAVADAGAADPDTPRDFIVTGDTADGAPIGVGTAAGVASAPVVAGIAPVELNAAVQIFWTDNLSLSEADQTSDELCGPGPVTSLAAEPGAQATAVEFNPMRPAQLVALIRQPSMLLIRDDIAAGEEPVRSVLLGGADITDTGHDLFHRVDTSVACAHCHPGGADDGRVWDFGGVGQRRTQSLETGLRAPFHWDGELEDMEHLMTDVFVGRMSGAPQSGPRLTALTQWLTSLSPPAPGVVTDLDLVERGRQLFESSEVGCAGCHSGVELTDGMLHDVGTASLPMKTPSLLGVSQRLPLMHDGCASTLRDRFSSACGGGDQHGATSHLSEAELDALTVYLGSL